MHYRLGVDIGGTFTDFVLEDIANGTLRHAKVLTTPGDPSDAVIEGIEKLLSAAGASAADVDVVIHGTTLATNAVIERKGARTGLLTTAGFVDVLAIGRESRYDHYDLQLELPEPLVARSFRRGVAERIDSAGDIVIPLDINQLQDELDQFRAAGIESIAVVYLHAYRNAVHERTTAELIAAVSADFTVSLSADVAPEIREYERTSTTVVNAYLQPVIERYLERLGGRLREMGIVGAFHLMLSSGLLTTAAQAQRFPGRLIESGPAGGAMLGTHYAQLSQRRDLIAFDMGGTTAKASLIQDGQVPVSREFEVARIERVKRGSGFPVCVPCVEIEEIGTGGSIAWIDRLGQLQVGPRSAGSDPGPACYGRDGRDPTVTDADLVLGYLNPDYFLGGELTLDSDAAARAIDENIARPLKLSLVQAAWGIHRVVNEEMANAFRIHAMEHGRDPGRHALLCFGGAGPVHAYGIARILHSPAIIAPAAAGVASALGFLAAPIAAEAAQSYVARLDRLDWDLLNDLLGALEASGVEFLTEAGIARGDATVSRTADMQYAGQMHDIAVAVPSGRLGAGDETQLRDAFDRRYLELFQRTVTRIPVEALTWRVTVSAPAPAIDLRWRRPASGGPRRKAERAIYVPGSGFVPAPVYNRYALEPGESLIGPAIVEERESTLVVGANARATMDEWGSLVIEPPSQEQADLP